MKSKLLIAALSITTPVVVFGAVYASNKPVQPQTTPVVQQISVKAKQEPEKKVEQVKTTSTTPTPAKSVKPVLERTKMPTKLPDPTKQAVLAALMPLKEHNGELVIRQETGYGTETGAGIPTIENLYLTGSIVGNEYNLVGDNSANFKEGAIPYEVRKINENTYLKTGTTDWINQGGFTPKHKKIIEFIETNLDDNYTIDKWEDSKQVMFTWNLTNEIAHKLMKTLDVDFSIHADGFESEYTESNISSSLCVYWDEYILEMSPTIIVNLYFRNPEWTKGVKFYYDTSFAYDASSDIVRPLVSPMK